MAQDPIIIDDGGSTRIKKLLRAGVGEMDKLLDVKSDVGPPVAGRPGSQQETEARGNPYGESITIACIDASGNHFTPPGFPLAFKSFTIESSGHQVDGDLVAGGKIRITVSGGNCGPVVEARQHNGRRRYIVSNSQRISRVTVRPEDPGPNVVFDASADSPAGLDLIYTSVIVT